MCRPIKNFVFLLGGGLRSYSLHPWYQIDLTWFVIFNLRKVSNYLQTNCLRPQINSMVPALNWVWITDECIAKSKANRPTKDCNCNVYQRALRNQTLTQIFPQRCFLFNSTYNYIVLLYVNGHKMRCNHRCIYMAATIETSIYSYCSALH